jgi:outer membrane immunogenic protein
MLRKFLTGVALGAMVLASGAASAADLARRPAPAAPVLVPSPAFSWAGLYVGAHLGYGFGEFTSGASVLDEANGLFGGVQAGYNWQFNNLVVGLEGDIALSGIRDSAPGLRGDLNWVGTFTPRVGVAFNTTLLYLKGGLAVGGAEARLAGVGSDDNLHVGWIVGGGIEQAFSQNWSVKLEYNYISLNAERYRFAPGTTASTGFEGHLGKLGVNYRF